MKTKKRHYSTFNIAGFSYWEGCIVFNELKIGTLLTLVREEVNKFDSYAGAIFYGESKLGYIPRSENKEISKFLELGYTNLFEARINRLTPDLSPEDQVGIIVYINPPQANQ
jgi:HIRAN domain